MFKWAICVNNQKTLLLLLHTSTTPITYIAVSMKCILLAIAIVPPLQHHHLVSYRRQGVWFIGRRWVVYPWLDVPALDNTHRGGPATLVLLLGHMVYSCD